MGSIYTPQGAALEYAPLALSLYRGCSFGCRYPCYVPACLRMTREEFAKPQPREGVIEALEKYLSKHAAEVRAKGPVLLSFSHDPYQPIEEEFRLTRQAIMLLDEHGCKVRLLTKAPLRAKTLDWDIFAWVGVDFGTTLSGVSDEAAKHWEPNAELPSMREQALLNCGLSTWLSMEPVIDIEGALETLRRLVGKVDRIMIGRWNHAKEAQKMDWRYFLAEAMKILLPTPQKFYIKDALWNSCARGLLFEAQQKDHGGWIKERL